MTTTGGEAGSAGNVGVVPADESFAPGCARRLFDRLARALEGEIDRLSKPSAAGRDKSGAKATTELIREAQRALMIVLDFQTKIDRRDPGDVDGALDLEAARAEINSRLDRLAERG